MTSIEKLAHIQETDARIRAIRKELTDIPERKAREKSRLNDQKARILNTENEIRSLKVTVDGQALEANSGREKRVRLRQQQMTLRTNQEFTAMEEEVSTIDKRVEEIEDAELEMLQRVEEANKHLEEYRGILQEESEIVQEDLDDLDDRADRIAQELAKCEGERAVLADGIEVSWLKYYERIAERRFPALVVLKDGICSGCNMKLPPASHHDVRKMDRIVTCNFCGRMLCSA